MICLDEKVLSDLYGLRETLLRVRNEGLEERFDMFEYESECGTVHCAAGWHSVFNADFSQPRKGYEITDFASSWAVDLSISVLVADDRGCIESKVFEILFGPHRSDMLSPHDSLTRQIAAANWFIHRIEALKEYERIRALPRRRRLGVAA